MEYIILILLLICPIYISGENSNGWELETEETLKKNRDIGRYLSLFQGETELVRRLAENVRDQGKKIQYQQRNINDLRKSLNEVSNTNKDLERQKKETFGSLEVMKELNELRKNLARQEGKMDETLDVLRELRGYAYQADNCAAIDGGHAHGVHRLYPNHVHPILACCDKSAGGEWTVIQKRFDGSVDFYRGWEEYAEGFGDPAGEYWLGLRHIHELTQARPVELYVGLTDFELGFHYAKYALFPVSSEEDKFRLYISNYSGNASDSLEVHNGEQFSTKDQDNDLWTAGECSKRQHGAWWYRNCYTCNLNGLYSKVKVTGEKYMTWYYLHADDRAMKASIMMIRPFNFSP